MNLVFHISEDGSEIKKGFASGHNKHNTLPIKLEPPNFEMKCSIQLKHRTDYRVECIFVANFSFIINAHAFSTYALSTEICVERK